MAFCTKGRHAVMAIINHITPVLDKIIETTLTFTGKLMEFTQAPGVAALLALIPGEPVFQAALVKAIDALTVIKEVNDEQDPAKKLDLFIADILKYDPKAQHGFMIKLASIISAIVHGQEEPTVAAKLTESGYDTILQTQVLINQHEAKAAA